MNRNEALQAFLIQHRLPPQFLQLVEKWFAPLAESLACHHSASGRPLLVGINGSQGSGKTTLASLLTLLLKQEYDLKSLALSLDDFYLSRESRSVLATNIHPLLATRGVPGTHDTLLMSETLQRLIHSQGPVSIPRFDKAVDDRCTADSWEQVTAPCDLVILEGWCLGTPAQSNESLRKPVNELESVEDPVATWRHYVNQQIGMHYEAIYQMVDKWIMLQAPSFDCIYQWRLEQERKLAENLDSGGPTTNMQIQVMSAQQISRFIQHYQRLTEHTLEQLPDNVDYLFQLDKDRQIVAAKEPRRVAPS